MSEEGRTRNIEENMVSIHFLGKKYKVPAGLTIMKAIEYAGYKIVRGAGCRAGFCGACSTVYRNEGEYKIQFAIACQELVEDGMYLTQIPFDPAPKAIYKLENLEPDTNVLLEYYPEVARCVSCNTCTKACPQDIEVMDYVQAALRGDIQKVAQTSFDCIQCGLCSMRCPADIKQYHVAQLARRLYGKYLSPAPKHLEERLEEIKGGQFDQQITELMSMESGELSARYEQRKIES